MPNINWPPNLIEELAYRRCVVFIGSGISATAKNANGDSPKTWGEFLNNAINLINGNSLYNDVEKLISEKKYLLALQTIHDLSDSGAYIHLLESEFSRQHFAPSDIHKYLIEIDQRISITTNFDKIYEKLCNHDSYCIKNYNDTVSLSDQMRSNNRILIKAHGDIMDIRNIIFTRQQYFDAIDKYPYFYRTLEAIFMTNTVLFLGYSLDDPDIQLLLENVYIMCKSAKPHYLVSLEGTSPIIRKDWKLHFNVELLEYGPTYADLTPCIEELKELVIGQRSSIGIV